MANWGYSRAKAELKAYDDAKSVARTILDLKLFSGPEQVLQLFNMLPEKLFLVQEVERSWTVFLALAVVSVDFDSLLRPLDQRWKSSWMAFAAPD